MWTLVAAAVMSSSPIPDLVLGEPSHGAKRQLVSVAVQENADTIDLTVTLALATDSPTWIETELPITLPPGGIVSALAIDTQWQTFVSRSEPVETARAHFEAAHRLPIDVFTGRPRDPALLEQTEGGLLLHVFPVAHDHPTTIRLYVTWPRSDGESIRRDWMSEDPTPRKPLDGQTALYAGPIVQLPAPGEPHHPHGHVALVPEPNLERLDLIHH